MIAKQKDYWVKHRLKSNSFRNLMHFYMIKQALYKAKGEFKF